MDYDVPEITDEQINAYILKRRLRKVLIVAILVVVVAVGAIVFFNAESKKNEEYQYWADQYAQYASNKNIIIFNGQRILLESDLTKFLKNFSFYYDYFSVRAKRNNSLKKTDLKTFLYSDKCVSDKADWLGWLGTEKEPQLIEINGFIKSGGADSCSVENLLVDNFVLRSGVVEKDSMKLDIANSTADDVLEYFDIDDGHVRGSNNSRVISIDALSTDDFEAEFWYDDNKYGEDPIKLVFVNKNSSNN